MLFAMSHLSGHIFIFFTWKSTKSENTICFFVCIPQNHIHCVAWQPQKRLLSLDTKYNFFILNMIPSWVFLGIVKRLSKDITDSFCLAASEVYKVISLFSGGRVNFFPAQSLSVFHSIFITFGYDYCQLFSSSVIYILLSIWPVRWHNYF